MKIRSLLFSVLCTLAMSLSFVACSSDDDDLIDDGSTLELPKTRAYFLNAGSSGMNNSGITFYAPNHDHDKVDDIYMTQNQKGLGDTGQDIIEYNDYMYVSVFGSRLLLKLNSAGVEQARLSFPGSHGAPRHLAAEDGKIYVTLYGNNGHVAKIDAKTMEIEGYVEIGKNPEGIVEYNDYLYAVNSGWGEDSTMTVIDTKTFTIIKTIGIAKNPESILESEGQIFIQAYGSNYTYPVQKVSFSGDTTTIAYATKMCEYNGTLYFVYGETDWTTYQTTNRFFSYNVKTGVLNNSSFMTNMPSELMSKSIYMMETNSDNGDMYIGTSDYSTNGDIYRFDKNGKFIEKFESGGISPYCAVFFN